MSVLYDSKSDGDAPVMLELWGMQSTPYIAIASRFTLVAPDRVLSMGWIELFDIWTVCK